MGLSNSQLFSRSLVLFRSEVRSVMRGLLCPISSLIIFRGIPPLSIADTLPWPTCMHRADRDSNLSANRSEHVAVHVPTFKRCAVARREDSTEGPAVEQGLHFRQRARVEIESLSPFARMLGRNVR